MVCCCCDGANEYTIPFIEMLLIATKYSNGLRKHLLLFAHRTLDLELGSFAFMQHWALTQTVIVTKQLLAGLNINILNWPYVSPNLNSIRDLYEVLSQASAF